MTIKDNQEAELLPCPFCSGRPFIVKDHLGGVIRCGNCQARMVVEPDRFGGKLNTSAWQARATLTTPQVNHDSDCAVHNEPAYPTGNCDCSLAQVNEEVASGEAVAWLCSYGKGLNTYVVDSLDKMDVGHEAVPLYLHPHTPNPSNVLVDGLRKIQRLTACSDEGMAEAMLTIFSVCKNRLAEYEEALATYSSTDKESS